MTINGIWEWANSLAHRVPVESLRGKTLAVDGHIWLYESLKGCATHHQTNPNSFLITFFTRIQRLRELKIIPIVVFDNITVNGSSNDDKEYRSRKRRSHGDCHFTNLADHVYKTNVLLNHLGVKVQIAPGDGEAQCAALEGSGTTSGCISTDFDYFLFGGKNLYRFDFSSDLKEVTHLSMGRMVVEKKITRSHLISSAILLGCDYYEKGVQGVGIATVFDILVEFGDEIKDEVDPNVILDRFSSYVRGEIPERSEDSERKLRLKRKNYNFPPEFPNCDVVQNAVKMYLIPSIIDAPVTKSVESPNAKKVEEILVNECGWTVEKVRNVYLRSQKRMRNNTNLAAQTQIPDFFSIVKKRRISPVVEPCKNVDEYISSNKTWIQKRKSGGAHELSSTPKLKLRSKNLTRRVEEPDGVIVLDSD